VSTAAVLARRGGAALIVVCGVLTLLAPMLAPNPPSKQFDDRSYAPPMRVHLWHDGRWQGPFVYPQVLRNRLMREFDEDRSTPAALRWFANGKVVSIDPSHGPLLLAGGDALGRDVWSRLLLGARRSLGVVLVGVAGALVLGITIGGLAGTVGGRVDDWLMLAADFVIVLPGAYLVLVLRSVLPIVLEPAEIFAWMAVVFAFAGWPHVARGVRAIVAAERAREYAEAARASGAGQLRLMSQLVPAARGFLLVELVLLVPALLVAEVTVSFLGLGFPEHAASWGTMLQDAAQVTVLSRAPWVLAPAFAVFVVTLALHLAAGSRFERSTLSLFNSR
jgi:peptide/nickel transport system permease protein